MTATVTTRFEKIADNFIETVLRDRPIMIYDIVSEVEEYIATIDDFKENNSKMLLDYFKNKTNQEEINNEIINALNYSDKQLEEATNISPEDNKQMLSTSVAVNEGYTNDPNPANYAASNQTLADLDSKITSYLCSIDQTYCENGPNAPVRIVRNAG
jgi:hypothetical protein